MWPFRKKPAPKPTREEKPRDCRDWNEDWKVGDVAECIVDGKSLTWAETLPPWERPSLGQRLMVSGFVDGVGLDRTRRYFLKFEDWPVNLTTSGFRKVRPVSEEKSEVVTRILNAKPGTDRVREDV